MNQPVILCAVRTPIGKFQGGLSPFAATELGAKVVAEAGSPSDLVFQFIQTLYDAC